MVMVTSDMYKMDINITSNTFYNDGSACSHLTGVAQGDSDGARTGNSILVKSLQVKGVVTRTTSGDAVQTCRIVIVQDRQNVADSSNPGYTTVFASSYPQTRYRDWETDRKSTRLNSSHSRASRMPSSA